MRWGGLVAALLVLDYYRWKKNDRTTFSDSIRYVLHTDTEEGKAALRLLLDLFYRHLIN